jgi:hypothetical protein
MATQGRGRRLLQTMTPEDRIVSDLADVVCKRIARQTRMALTKITDCRLSGEDSPLKNSWEEICVQCQTEESSAWSAYEETIRAYVTGFVEQLQRHEIEAIYLQTEDACDLTDEEAEQKPLPVNESCVVDYIIKQHLYTLADGWSNKRIREFIDRGYGD